MRKHNFNFPENNQFVYVIVLWDVFHLMYVMEGRSREWSERKKWYECCFKNNTSYFILSAHDIRGGCWWYSSRSWTFPPIFHYILLLCDRWQQRGRQNGVWHVRAYEAKMCHWIPPCGKKCHNWHLLMLVECLWRPNSGCEHSEAVGGTFQQWRHCWVDHLH